MDSLRKPMLNFRGAPTQPMRPEELDAKFMAAARAVGAEKAGALQAGLKKLEWQNSVAELLQSM